ncbi:uncharacterized protein L3040_008418 [Drepanopeziza brunnea f. sp. 'multigermtubi']|uniref:uncharacterized protein n=1 Tax=Drepanopeziza brunnea f. sp. 'multigermtubi' TaxID=698441 RepID=UPI0023974FA1|nr:hypothetical protein L3040_008418 [Drepanopeziza brunnea f. sp. 'multigermtubi']
MVSIKAVATVLFISVASAQNLFTCWCGNGGNDIKTACKNMMSSGWLNDDGSRCIVSESLARDYFLKTACTLPNKGC